MSLKLLIATNNPGKMREIQAILADLPLALVTPFDVGLHLDVAETGSTYRYNAALKATAFCRASGLHTLADDSGLEVAALDGAPGVHSARYSSKPNASDADRRALLLSNLHSKKQPWPARFRCTVAIADPSIGAPTLYYTDGQVDGYIIPVERGSNGFGYDPIFYMPELRCTMAELKDSEKNEISHRARALKAARSILEDLI